MKYYFVYPSELGKILLLSDGVYLTGLYFDDTITLGQDYIYKHLDVFDKTCNYLDQYFSGLLPDIDIPIRLEGTSFQKEVWNILLTIPYGQTMTYGQIAKLIAKKKGIEKMSAQAIGGAVGKNPISIIVPCHRVLGTNQKLVGYAGGIERKKKLLEIERIINES